MALNRKSTERSKKNNSKPIQSKGIFFATSKPKENVSTRRQNTKKPWFNFDKFNSKKTKPSFSKYSTSSRSRRNNFKPQSSQLKLNLPSTKKIKNFILNPKEQFENTKHKATEKLVFFRKFILQPQTQKRLIIGFITTILLSIIYITFFTSVFLVKNYRVSFENGSYLDQNGLQEILTSYSKNNFLLVLPANHFWFVNSDALTNIANKQNSSIQKVELTGRYWPNIIDIKITTKPILATLKVNDDYYLVSQSGVVVGRDEGGLRKNVVNVLTYQKKVTVNELTRILTEDLNFSPEEYYNGQLSRLYFIQNMNEQLKSRNLEPVLIEIFSLSEQDSDVNFYTQNNTLIQFDSKNQSIEENLNRLDVLLNTTNIGKEIQDGKIKYIDFRIKGRVYTCYVGTACDKKE